MFVSTAEGRIAPFGRSATANPCTVPWRVNRAPATRSAEISNARGGWGVSSLQRVIRFITSGRPAFCMGAMLLNEGHLVDFPQSGQAISHLGQSAQPQRNHTFSNRRALDLRGRPPVHNHFADMIAQVQQLADRRASVESGPRALQASGTLGKLIITSLHRLDPA